jgi:hypothetical protein
MGAVAVKSHGSVIVKALSNGVRSFIGARRAGIGQSPAANQAAPKSKSLKMHVQTKETVSTGSNKKRASTKVGKGQERPKPIDRPLSRKGLGLAASRVSLLSVSKRRESRILARSSSALVPRDLAPTASVMSMRLIKMVKTKTGEPARSHLELEVKLRVRC